MNYKINYIGGAFTCSYCGETFSKKEDFTKHLKDNPSHVNQTHQSNAGRGRGRGRGRGDAGRGGPRYA